MGPLIHDHNHSPQQQSRSRDLGDHDAAVSVITMRVLSTLPLAAAVMNVTLFHMERTLVLHFTKEAGHLKSARRRMMSGIAETNVVDIVGQDASGRFLVIMVESRVWGAEEAQATQLKEKINAYAGFIMDGGLARKYPETAGQPVDIQLDCEEAPSGEFATILRHAATQLQRLGIGLRVNVTAKHVAR